jgi:putative transcriptional regulator
MFRLALYLFLFQAASAAQAIPAGKLLVATSKSHDPDLAKSVVLIVHSDAEGAIGLILNHPVQDLYFGGPVTLGARCLFRSSSTPQNAEHVFADVYLATKPMPNGRLYAGYTGWSAVQLRDEVSRGLWQVRDATAALVFDPHPATLWARLIR